MNKLFTLPIIMNPVSMDFETKAFFIVNLY